MSALIRDGNPLRVPCEHFPGIKERVLTLIRVDGDSVRFDTSVPGKRGLLADNPDAARYMAVWTGKYTSDVFDVSPALRQRWTQELGIVA